MLKETAKEMGRRFKTTKLFVKGTVSNAPSAVRQSKFVVLGVIAGIKNTGKTIKESFIEGYNGTN